jgi:serine kinase of HPr protein (carbohydrate metabolism regulator)
MSETAHGTAVLAGVHGTLIRGAPGSGKSMLAFALIERGARLIADDRVHLSACHGRIVASAVAPIAGLLELRGRGIVAVPHERSGVIGLVVDIVSEAALERMPDNDQMTAALLGVALPRQPVPPALERAAMLVEAALAALLPQCNTGLRTARVWR